MNTRFLQLIAACSTTLVLLSQPALAHDPAEHAKEAASAKAAPNCAAMQSMDRSKMDMNDPVMKAMHARCAAKMRAEPNSMSNMDHSKMEGMDHSQMNMGSKPPAPSNKPAPSANGHEGH
jgi:uncharacterized protein involved in copper resistance